MATPRRRTVDCRAWDDDDLLGTEFDRYCSYIVGALQEREDWRKHARRFLISLGENPDELGRDSAEEVAEQRAQAWARKSERVELAGNEPSTNIVRTDRSPGTGPEDAYVDPVPLLLEALGDLNFSGEQFRFLARALRASKYGMLRVLLTPEPEANSGVTVGAARTLDEHERTLARNIDRFEHSREENKFGLAIRCFHMFSDPQSLELGVPRTRD